MASSKLPMVPSHKHWFSHPGRPRNLPSNDLRQFFRKPPAARDLQTLAVVGQGAYGMVRVVRHLPSKEICALKQMAKVDLTLKSRESLVMQEINVLYKAQSPWIPRLYYAWQDDHFVYLLMEFTSGGDMMKHLAECRHFTESTCRFYVAELVLALAYVHQGLQCVHRDIKPENILLDSRGHIKLADFGLSKFVGSSPASSRMTTAITTATSKVNEQPPKTKENIAPLFSDGGIPITFHERLMTGAGTTDYMAPEIHRFCRRRGRGLTKGTVGYNRTVDWWSVGVVLFDMLFGTLPFTDRQRIGHVTTDRIIHLLADPDERFKTAAEAAAHPWLRAVNWEHIREQAAPLQIDRTTLGLKNFDLVEWETKKKLEAEAAKRLIQLSLPFPNPVSGPKHESQKVPLIDLNQLRVGPPRPSPRRERYTARDDERRTYRRCEENSARLRGCSPHRPPPVTERRVQADPNGTTLEAWLEERRAKFQINSSPRLNAVLSRRARHEIPREQFLAYRSSMRQLNDQPSCVSARMAALQEEPNAQSSCRGPTLITFQHLANHSVNPLLCERFGALAQHLNEPAAVKAQLHSSDEQSLETQTTKPCLSDDATRALMIAPKDCVAVHEGLSRDVSPDNAIPEFLSVSSRDDDNDREAPTNTIPTSPHVVGRAEVVLDAMDIETGRSEAEISESFLPSGPSPSSESPSRYGGVHCDADEDIITTRHRPVEMLPSRRRHDVMRLAKQTSTRIFIDGGTQQHRRRPPDQVVLPQGGKHAHMLSCETDPHCGGMSETTPPCLAEAGGFMTPMASSPLSFRSVESSGHREANETQDAIAALLHTSLDNLLSSPATDNRDLEETFDLVPYLSSKKVPKNSQSVDLLPASSSTPTTAPLTEVALPEMTATTTTDAYKNTTTPSLLDTPEYGASPHCVSPDPSRLPPSAPLPGLLNDLLVFSDDDFAVLAAPGHSEISENSTVAATPPPVSRADRDAEGMLDFTPPVTSFPDKEHPEGRTTTTPTGAKLLTSDSTSQFNAVLSFFHSELPSQHPPATSPTVNAALFQTAPPRDSRPAANVPDQQLEDVRKTTIYVLFQNSCTPVSWCSDMTVKDIREMVLCACDAMIDSGFVLREVIEVSDKDDEYVMEAVVNGKTLLYKYGRRFEFEELDQLMPGGTYTLQKATEREDLKKITGDRCRKLKVRIEPLLHVEAIKAIAAMKRGTNLLKHTELGFPHLRQFQLSSDCQRLLWYSSSDANQQTSLQIKSIREIRLGQQSPLFRAYKLPSLEHLSFSLFYESPTAIPKALATILPKLHAPSSITSLDITCKDEIEFDNWICGLKALVFHANSLLISKEELLSHSRRFRTAMAESFPGLVLSSASLAKTSAKGGLEDCLDLPVHSLPDLTKKIERLQASLLRAEKRMEQFDLQYDPHGDLSRASRDETADADLSSLMLPPRGGTETSDFNDDTVKREAQSSIFKDVSIAEDDRLEYRRMRELRVSVVELMQQAKSLLQDLPKEQSLDAAKPLTSHKGALLKQINQLLWKAEVDIENIDDMLSRLKERRESPESGLASFLSKLSKILQ